MASKRIENYTVLLPCPFGECPHVIRGRTEQSAEAEKRRHVSVVHGKALASSKGAERSVVRRFHEERRRVGTQTPAKARWDRLSSLFAPRGETGNFDSTGAADVLALVLPRRAAR